MIGETQRTISSAARSASGRLRAQARELGRVLDQREHAAGRRVAGGLVPGRVQEEAVAEDLVVRERAAVDARGDHRAHQVVAGADALLAQDLGVAREDPLARRHRDADRLAALVVLGVARADRQVREPQQLGPVGARHAEQLHDDGQRQARRDLVDEVELLAVAEALERAVDDLARQLGDARLERRAARAA